MARIYVINAKGEKEPLSFRKIYRSARRVGAPAPLAQKIATIVHKKARPGIKTSEIFRRVKGLLIEQLPGAALRFNLKEGMRKLGPTGFPFEKYIGEIFSREKFKVQLNQFIPGKCADYEIDFLAKNDKVLYIGECKYHNVVGGRVDLHVVLADYARFLDIKQGYFFRGKRLRGIKIKSLIVTNAKFTTKAIRYSQCVGTELLGWNWPKNKGLEDLIDTQKLYPITILPSLKHYLVDVLISKNLMLVQDVLKINTRAFSRKFKIPIAYLESLKEETRSLLES